MKRSGFTMIELIFVIVILGILAAVAVPKLTATRGDASQTAILSDYKSAIKTITGAAMAGGAQPDLTTLFTVGGNIAAVTKTVLTLADDNTSVCATLTVDATTLTPLITSANKNCNLLSGESTDVIQILGSAVTR